MKNKKKLIISLSVAIAILLISIVAIVSVSAALNQNISSKVKVNFKPSQHVIGYVSAKYTFGDVTHDMTTNGKDDGDTSVMFSYNEKEKVKTLQMRQSDLQNGRLNMLSNKEDIIFVFTFRNTGYSNFDVVLDTNGVTTEENIKLSYSLDGNTWLDEIPEIAVKAPIYSTFTTKRCFIKMEAADIGSDAMFEGFFVWNLIAEEDN